MEKRKTLLFLIPRGEAIRNFVYSDITRKLKEDYNLIFFSVIPNQALRSYLKENCDELYELESLKLSYPQRLLHDIMHMAHNRYLWSEAAKVRWKMRQAETQSFFQKFAWFIKKIIALPLANNRALRLIEKLDLWIAQNNRQVKSYREKIRKIAPDLVFNGSHSHANIVYPLIQAARLEKIKTAAFLFSWDNLTSQGRILPPHDYYFAWNENIKQQMLNIYPSIAKGNTFVIGTPQFIWHYQYENHLSGEELRKQLGLRADEKYFLYSSGMSHHMPLEPYVVARIADIIKKLGSKYRLVVRTYAKDRGDVFNKLKAERPDIIIPDVKWEKKYQTPLIEDQIFFSSMLKHCVGGINVASTISLELCMFDKPAINVGYNPPGKDIYPYNYTRFYSFDHYKPIVDSGAVQVAKDEEEMEAYLREAIQHPEKLERERRDLISKFFEGKSGVEVVSAFVQKINQLSM